MDIGIQARLLELVVELALFVWAVGTPLVDVLDRPTHVETHLVDSMAGVIVADRACKLCSFISLRGQGRRSRSPPISASRGWDGAGGGGRLTEAGFQSSAPWEEDVDQPAQEALACMGNANAALAEGSPRRQQQCVLLAEEVQPVRGVVGCGEGRRRRWVWAVEAGRR